MRTFFSFRPVLAGSISALLLASTNVSHAVDGTWLGAPNNTGWSNPAYWQGGVIPGGINANAYFVFDSISDTDLVRGANIIQDFSSLTVGNIYMADVDGLGSSSVALNTVPAAPFTTLTLQTTTGTAPMIDVNLLLNNAFNGKKAILGANLTLAGTQGFNKTGPGYLSLRNTMALSGDIGVLGGTLDTRVVLNNNINVSGAGVLSLDFNSFAGTNDLINNSRTLTLGGISASGYVTTVSKAAVLTQSLAGLVLNTGGHSIQANANSATNTFTWNLGTITRNAGSALNLYGANTFTFQFTAGGSVAGNDSGGIAGGWLTFNSNDWGRVNGSAITAVGVPYTNNAWGPNLNTTVNAVNFPSIPGANTQNSATTHSLRFQDVNARILTLTGTNVLETGGVLFGNSANAMHQLNGGAITPSNGVSDLIVHGYSTGGGWGVILNSNIVDNNLPVQFVKAGTGNVVFDGDKSFTGSTVLGQGTLVMGKALGGSSTGSVVGNILNSGVLAFNRSGTYTVANTITGNGLVAQWADGTLVLNKSISAGGLMLQNGTTTLDFASVTAPQDNIVPAGVQTATGLWTEGGRLTLRDAALNITGKAGINHTQAFAITDIQGASSLNLQPGTGGTVTLSLGAYNRPNNSADGAGTLKITLPAGAAVATMASFPGAASSLVQDNGQAFVTVNDTDWGAKNAANTRIISGSDPSFSGTFYTPLSTLTAGSNADYNINTTVSANTTFASLRFHRVATPAAMIINAGVQLSVGGLLISAGAVAPTQIGGSGSISAASTGGHDLPIFQNSKQPVTISAVVADFAAGQVTNLVKDGTGDLILAGTNTYTGATFVQGGTLRVIAGGIGTLAAAGNVFVREGEMRIENTAVVNTGGNYISIGQRLGETGTLTLQDNSNWTTTGDFNVSDVNSTGILNIRDNATLNAGNFYVGKVGASIGTVNLAGGTILINGNTADVRIGGANAGDSIAQGTINQSAGAFAVNRNYQLGAYGIGVYNQTGGSFDPGAGFMTVGRYISGQGTWNLSGGSIDATPAATGAAFIVGEEGSGTMNVSGGIFLAKNLSLGHNNGVGVINQTGGAVTVIDTGVAPGLNYAQSGIVLGGAALGDINNSSGAYQLNGGALTVNSITRAVGRGDFVFNGGTLSPLTSNTAFMQGLTSATVRTGGAVINTAGSDINIGQSLTHDITLGPAVDGGLTKTGAGTLSLHGFNSYTGATTISDGTLKLAAATPASIWDASTLSGPDGTPVGSWSDSVGFKNAGQAVAGNQPQLFNGSLNGLNVLRFNGSAAQSLVVANTDSAVSASSSFTIAAVVRTSSFGAGGAAQWWSNTGIVDAEIGGSNNDWGLGYNGSGNVSGGLGSFTADQTLYSSAGIVDGAAHVLLLSVDNGTIRLAVDGVTQTLGTTSIAARALNQFRIGGISTANNYFTGDIAEVQIFRSGMSGAALSAAGKQLATKYGLSGAYSNVSDFLPDSSNVNLTAATSVLALNGFSETVGSLSGVAGSSVTLGGGTLTAGADNSSTSFGGSISGAGSLAKSGSGILTLIAGSVVTPVGGTLITGGRLIVNGNLSGSVDVNGGGALGGVGVINTGGSNLNVALGGKLAPGVLTNGNLIVSLGGGQLDISPALAPLSSGALLFELGSPAASDKVTLTGGPLTIGTGLLEFNDFQFSQLAGFGAGTYTLFDGNTLINGTLGSSRSGVIGSLVGTLGTADSGRDLILTVAVPEPGTLVSLLGGISLLALRRRRRCSL